MAKYKLTLGIGYHGATHEDVIEISDDEFTGCETEQDRQEVLNSYWMDWSGNFIDGGIELIG